MRLIPLLVVLPLVGCGISQAEKQRQAFLASLVGVDETTLLQRMGVPDKTYSSGDHKYLAYDQSTTEVSGGEDYPDAFPGMGFGAFGFGGAGMGFGAMDFPPTVETLSCEVTFDVFQGKVQSFTQQGNAC